MAPFPTPKVDRILAVDDSPDNLFLIQQILAGRGYDVSVAEDGASALAAIEQSPPDLILLDVMMPGIDGYEVTRRVRENPRLPYIPILLITAHTQPSAVIGLDSGADDFIRKPVNMEELWARVRSLLRLKHSIDEREQLSRQREDFVSRLTHDLRTPLVAADRVLNLLQQEAFGVITPSMAEMITQMIRSNQNLLQMVNSILEVYRHEAGRKNLAMVHCDLREILSEVVQELMPLAEQEGLTLTIESDFDEDVDGKVAGQSPVVMGDRIELRRVFTNLIGNAIKFTDDGSVQVRLKADPQSTGTPSIMVEVQDTGQGITDEDLATLFERFHQGQHRRSGSGLGLYLAHCIVQAHQGKIEVQSQVDQGSLFRVRLPAQVTRSLQTTSS
ncbi:MAG: hybrid sensor histidine kinase/response regulator [Oculatellaceae cyanobacterium Prado106]|jgi:signal transduction histidine kinase|nr:hybrid sensor histidine kinase/response regulator [Oculatellaceae cyanobacterium Prado106]